MTNINLFSFVCAFHFFCFLSPLLTSNLSRQIQSFHLQFVWYRWSLYLFLFARIHTHRPARSTLTRYRKLQFSRLKTSHYKLLHQKSDQNPPTMKPSVSITFLLIVSLMLIKSSEQSYVNKISGGHVCDINNIGLQACKDDYQYFECTPSGFLVRSVAPGTICVDVGSSSSSTRSTAFSILTLILSLTLILGWEYAHAPMI